MRTVGDEHEPTTFSTWCPKVIAKIRELPDTLRDRSIVIRMRRKAANEQVERLRLDKPTDFARLLSKACRWAQDHLNALKACDPGTPYSLSDRAADNWRSLLAIADEIGSIWPEAARAAAEALSGTPRAEDAELSNGVALLRDIRAIFDELKQSTIAPTPLVLSLHEIEESQWSDYRFGRAISAKDIARLLRPFEIKSRRNKSQRFYSLADFEDAWTRYLPPSGLDSSPASVTPVISEHNQRVTPVSHPSPEPP